MIPNKLYMTINISCFVFLCCFFPAVVVVSVAANKQQGATGSEQHAGNSHNTYRYNSRRMDDHRNAQELQQDEEREQHAQSKHRNTKKKTWQRQQRWQQEEWQLGRLPKKKHPGHPWSHLARQPPFNGATKLNLFFLAAVGPIVHQSNWPWCGSPWLPKNCIDFINQLGKCIDTARSSIAVLVHKHV